MLFSYPIAPDAYSSAASYRMTTGARAVELLYPWPRGGVSCKPMTEGGQHSAGIRLAAPN